MARNTYSGNRRAVAAYNAVSRARREQAAGVAAYYGQVKERNVQKIIVDLCEKAQIPYMRNRDVKLVKRKDGTIVPSKLAESQRGKPDLTVVGLSGRTIWIETKSPKGKLNPAQEEWRDKLVGRGHDYFAPHTPDEAEVVCQIILTVGRKVILE